MVFQVKRIAAILLLFVGLSAQPCLATFSLNELAHGKIDLQLGLFNAYQGRSQNIAINGLVGDHFSVTSHNDQNVLLGIGYFIDAPDQCKTSLKYGINAFYLANTTVTGNVSQEMQFENLSYNYDVTNIPLYLALKSITNTSMDKYRLTLDIGIGPNIIKTSNVDENSRDGGITVPDHMFSGNTSIALSAMAGIGLKSDTIECGYRLFYLGQGNFDKVTGQLKSTLKTGNGYANALLCTITL